MGGKGKGGGDEGEPGRTESGEEGTSPWHPIFIPKPPLWGWLLVEETKPAEQWEQKVGVNQREFG